MPGDEVTVAQLCGKCNAQLDTFSVKKDNLMLTSTEPIWCPHCGENTPEVRDIVGRNETIQKEIDGYPKSAPARKPQSPPDSAPDSDLS